MYNFRKQHKTSLFRYSYGLFVVVAMNCFLGFFFIIRIYVRICFITMSEFSIVDQKCTNLSDNAMSISTKYLTEWFGWVQGDYFRRINDWSSGWFITQIHFCPARWAFAIVLGLVMTGSSFVPKAAAALLSELVIELSLIPVLLHFSNRGL